MSRQYKPNTVLHLTRENDRLDVVVVETKPGDATGRATAQR